MSTYRKEWDCCGSVTETECWEPNVCPICSSLKLQEENAKLKKDLEDYRSMRSGLSQWQPCKTKEFLTL